MKLNKSSMPSANAASKPTEQSMNAGVGMVHLGFGAFHRAHQALITDTLLKEHGGDWKIVGVCNWGAAGQSIEQTGLEASFANQDNLYTVAVGQDETLSLAIVGAVEQVLFSNQVDAILGYMTQPSVKVVSLTITEKGYCHHPATGRLNLEHPQIQHDLAHLDEPHTAIGFLVAALKKRREDKIAPFTPLSCDNLPHNGVVLQNIILDFAKQLDPKLHDWIAAEVSFPSTMVDRIVPQTSAADQLRVNQALGLEDQQSLVTEPFLQWVIEDKFCNERPAWEKTSIDNIIITDDVTPFEKMKLRLLNGTHSAMAYLGYLAGYQTINQTIQDEAYERFIRYLMDIEISPSLNVEGINLGHYKDSLIARYKNSALKHRTWQIAMDGSQKIPPRFLQTIAYGLQHNIETPGLYLALAAWMKYTRGVDERGAVIDVRDPMAEQFADIWLTNESVEEVVEAFLQLSAIFPPKLAKQAAFKANLLHALELLLEKGAKQSVYDFKC
ncbi:mannitol dehydrogenase family protein [Agarivorans sp. QJM3NY_25]|uniref:mannitol dehydrogenase family protein n=1 Tax=Agarivorans sp. QJM3NY_25 TaxID=3421430 RepID=UPI003D7DAEB5